MAGKTKSVVFASPRTPTLTVLTKEGGPTVFRGGYATVTNEKQADELREWAEQNPGFGVEEGGKVDDEGRIETKRAHRATVAESVTLPGGAESGVSPMADMTPAQDEDENGEPQEDAPIKTVEEARFRENVSELSAEGSQQGGDQSAGTGATGPTPGLKDAQTSKK